LVFKQPFFIINHFQLDNLAADLASKAGASIISGETVDGAKLKELTQNYERIIGADGAFSAVRKYLALPNPEFWLGIQFFEKNMILLISLKLGQLKMVFCGAFRAAMK